MPCPSCQPAHSPCPPTPPAPLPPCLPPCQIFDELRKIGRRHELSAGLLIGGKDVKEEKARVHGE